MLRNLETLLNTPHPALRADLSHKGRGKAARREEE